MDVELLPLIALLAAAVLAAAAPARGADLREAFHVEGGPPEESFDDAVVRVETLDGGADYRVRVESWDGVSSPPSR